MKLCICNIIVLGIYLLCNSFGSGKTNKPAPFQYFSSGFKPISMPFEIGDSMLWESTYVQIEGMDSIDSKDVIRFLSFEKMLTDTIVITEIAKYYKVGQFNIGRQFTALIYLKSYKRKFIEGGTKDIYRLVTFNAKGNKISQIDVAGFISETKQEDRVFWNKCIIRTDTSFQLVSLEQINDYDLDTAYTVSKKETFWHISKDGSIVRH